MSAIGALTVVLHSHIPYARLADGWLQAESQSVASLNDTLLPVQALWGVRDEGLTHKVTIGLLSTARPDLADKPFRFAVFPMANTDEDELDEEFDDDFDDDFDEEDDLEDDFEDDDFDDDFEEEDLEDDLVNPLDRAVWTVAAAGRAL